MSNKKSPSKKPKNPRVFQQVLTPFPRPRDLYTEPQWQQLNKVIDPELGIGIVDLGLVYDLKVSKKNDNIKITMTLTSPGCPVAPMILQDVETTMLMHNPTFKKVQIKIVWDPPWTHEKMNEDIREMLMGF